MIPDYQSIMLPLLRIASDMKVHRVGDMAHKLAQEFGLTESDLAKMLRSGKQSVFSNRVHWAKTYLSQAQLLEMTGRGQFKITERGLAVLTDSPEKIGVAFLDQFAEFREFKLRSRESQQDRNLSQPRETSQTLEVKVDTETPDEVLRATVAKIDAALSAELLDRIHAAPPVFFENLIVQLLLRMGYGGAREEAGRTVGKSGDGGIDGVIDQDPLGLDRIYLQAKRYRPDLPVSEPEIRAFSGSLGGAKASKGVFVTTSSFTRPAHEFAERHPFKLVLIDGTQLTALMIRYDVGVRTTETLLLKKVDDDYFEQD